jgi:hypothetical protein
VIPLFSIPSVNPPRLKTYLTSSQELKQLTGQAARLAALQRHFQAIVPPSLGHGSQVTQLRQQTLFIAATNGSVAAKLKQISDELISLFQARGCEVTGIRVTVQVQASSPKPLPAGRQLGAAARQALDSLEGDLPDSPLKQALRRLTRKR